MGGPVHLSYHHAPTTALLFPRALLPRPTSLRAGTSIPRLSATLSPATPNPRHVARYRDLCGFAFDSVLPPTYPHVLAAPLHLALLVNGSFPLRVLGAVHVRNHIHQHRALRVDERLGVETWLEGHVEVEGGLEVAVHTTVRADDVTAWEAVSTMLLRTPGGGRKEARPFTPPDYSGFRAVTEVRAAEDTGRRYGRVAHDLNPIHVHALTARAFGFPRAIAHGMWSFARCVAELQRATVVGPCTLEVAFKRPLPLPSRAFLVAREADGRTAFALHDGVIKTVYLTGTVEA